MRLKVVAIVPRCLLASLLLLEPALVSADTQFSPGSGVTSFMGRRGPIQLQQSDLPSFTIETAPRSILSFLQEGMTVRDFGARCDGSFDDSAPLTAMTSITAFIGHAVIPQNCRMRIATALTISAPVEIKAGGQLIPDHVVVALNGGFQAPSSAAVFAPVNGGSITLGTTQDRYPEQWGAQPNTAGFDNTAPINAAIAAGPGNVKLIAPSYTYVGPLVDTVPKVHVIGAGDQATYLVQNSAIADGFDFGAPIVTNAPIIPAAAAALYSSLEHVLIYRAVAPSAALGSAPFNAAAKGVSMQGVGWVTLKDVHAYGSRIGIYRRHTFNTFTERTISEFDFTHTYGGQTAIGGDALNFYTDSQDSNYGSQANASSTDTDSLALCDNSQAGATTQSASYYWRGNFSDYFGQKLQSAGCNGPLIDGSGADVNNGGTLTGANAGTGNTSTNDFEVVDLIVDGFRDFGLKVINVPANFPKIGFDGGYLLNGYTVASRAIDIESNGVSITGSWSIDGWQNTNAGSFCLYVSGARQTVIGNGVTLLGCTNPVFITGSAGYDIQPTIQNKDTRAAANPAIVLLNSSYGRIAPAIDAFNANGAVSGAYASAVRIVGGAGSSGNEINLTRALPYSFVGGLPNILCDDAGNGTVNATYTASSTGAPFFGQRLCSGKNLITGAQP